MFGYEPKGQGFESLAARHVVTDFVSFVTAFLLKKPSFTHAVVPPFRNRSRSSRLFGCKRPHDGFVSLPPCFGWGGISKFDLCLFIWRLYCNRLFSYIRLTASSIATQWYSAFSRVILPAAVEKANIISLCRRNNITFAKAKISRRTKWGISQKSNKNAVVREFDLICNLLRTGASPVPTVA